MPADFIGIWLKPMTVDSDWLHVWIDGMDTEYVLRATELGDLSDIVTKFRFSAFLSSQGLGN